MNLPLHVLAVHIYREESKATKVSFTHFHFKPGKECGETDRESMEERRG